MTLLNGKAAFVVAGVAAVISVAGTAAVQAQPAADHSVDAKVAQAKATLNTHANRFGFGPGQALTQRGVYTDVSSQAASGAPS